MPLIVITGANGFIGNNLVERFLAISPDELGFDTSHKVRFSNFESNAQELGFRVLATDLADTVNRMTARRFAGSARYTFVMYEDLIKQLEKLTEKPLAIIHNGACSSTTETDPAVFQKLNLGYSKLLWNYCSENKIPFIYASSAAVYGDGSLGFSDKKEDCAQYQALNLYGKSKLDFDLWALQQKNTPPSWFGLRYFNVYGQFESHKGGQASMVYHGYNQAVRTGKIKLFKSNVQEYNDGEQKRDFVYVDDLVSVTLELVKISLKRKDDSNCIPIERNGLFLNIGTGVANTWNQLAKEVFQSLSLPVTIEYIQTPDNIIRQYQNFTCADLASLRSLGIQHEFKSLKDGVQKYVQKHLMRGQ